jgi:serine/threonine protein phosphatase 1
VVHGHTPTRDPYLGTSRIGVDTGAYATGVLTAVRLFDETQSVLQVGGD